MKTVQVTLRGNKPLLMNRFKDSAEEDAQVTRGKKNYGTPLEQATKAAYIENGQLYMPWTWVSGAIRHVAGSFKSSLNKKIKSLKGLVGGAVIVKDPKIFFTEELTIDDVEVNSVGAVVQRARIMRHRPQINQWTATFTIAVQEELVTIDEVREMLKDAGQRAGVGDFRISKGGPYGTFDVIDFKELK